MAKKPNAAQITHGLAQLGGGSKKEGGGGMLKGVENIFKSGIDYGSQQVISSNESEESTDSLPDLQTENKSWLNKGLLKNKIEETWHLSSEVIDDCELYLIALLKLYNKLTYN